MMVGFLFLPSFHSSSGRLPKSSGQYSSGRSSLHQHWGETSLLWEFPDGLHQQLPGYPAGYPGKTSIEGTFRTIKQVFFPSKWDFKQAQYRFTDMTVFTGPPRAWCALSSPRSAQYGPGLHLGGQQRRQGAGLRQCTAPAGRYESRNLPLLHPQRYTHTPPQCWENTTHFTLIFYDLSFFLVLFQWIQMRHFTEETPSFYQRSTSCVRPWLDRSWTTWRFSVGTR